MCGLFSLIRCVTFEIWRFYLNRGNTDPSLASLTQSPIQINTPKYIGNSEWVRSGFSNRRLVATAPPKYPVSKIAPSTEVCGTR